MSTRAPTHVCCQHRCVPRKQNRPLLHRRRSSTMRPFGVNTKISSERQIRLNVSMNSNELPALCWSSSKLCNQRCALTCAVVPLLLREDPAFIRPVCCDTFVGHLLHIFGTDLNLYRYPVREWSLTYEEIGSRWLWYRNVIFHAARAWLVQAVSLAKCAITSVWVSTTTRKA